MDLSNLIDLKSTYFILTSVLSTLIFFYFWKIWRSYGFFKRMGIKTPPYTFIKGNLDELIKDNLSECMYKWTQKYGKVYGYFEGHLPVLVTSDLEIINEVFIKQYFSNFTARKLWSNIVSDDSPKVNLLFASKNKWKRMRNIINPTFSPAKLKELIPLLKMCSDRFMTILEKNLNKEVDVTDLTGKMTLDAIFNCAFGIDDDMQNKERSVYIEKSRDFIKQMSKLNFFTYFNSLFHEFKRFVMPTVWFVLSIIGKINPEAQLPYGWLNSRIDEIIQMRLQQNAQRKDYLQLLFNACSESTDTVKDQASDLSLVQKTLTTEEIKINVILFLIAGFETTSTTLSNCIHVLTQHPDELVKLQEEIESNLTLDDECDYESLNKLEYLDCFIKEVLRLHNIGGFLFNRRCTEPVEIKGIKIPKDLIVAADIESIHRNPEYWGSVDPNEFYPLRFKDPSINKQAFIAFGIGPRLCVGMRFGLLELKMTLAKLVRRFDILPGQATPDKLKFSEGVGIRRPAKPVSCVFKPRAYNL